MPILDYHITGIYPELPSIQIIHKTFSTPDTVLIVTFL